MRNPIIKQVKIRQLENRKKQLILMLPYLFSDVERMLYLEEVQSINDRITELCEKKATRDEEIQQPAIQCS